MAPRASLAFQGAARPDIAGTQCTPSESSTESATSDDACGESMMRHATALSISEPQSSAPPSMIQTGDLRRAPGASR
jgi:hypothetical protein